MLAQPIFQLRLFSPKISNADDCLHRPTSAARHLLGARILESFENEIRCAGFHGCTWYARYRSTNPRRGLRQRGLPIGMRRPEWCCGRAQSTSDQTALSLLRQWGLPSGMHWAEWGRSRAQAIIAQFPGSRGATHQELNNQELAPAAGRASRYIAASECGSLRFHFAARTHS